MEGAYQSISIHRTDDEHLWGGSDVLNLDPCRERGELRWYDPAARDTCRPLATNGLPAAAEARVLDLEEQLRRVRGQGS